PDIRVEGTVGRRSEMVEVRADDEILAAQRGIATREDGEHVLRRERRTRRRVRWRSSDEPLEVARRQWTQSKRGVTASDVRGGRVVAWRSREPTGERVAREVKNVATN